MNRQNYFLGGLINEVVNTVGGFVDDVSDFFTLEDVNTAVSDAEIFGDFDAGLLQQAAESGDAVSFITDDFGTSIAPPSFFDQVSGFVSSGIDSASDFLSSEFVKEGAKAIAGKYVGQKAGSSAQQQARARRSEVLGAGRGVGVSGSAPARQFTPGSVQSMIARTNAGRQAFQPGTVDTRQNLVNIVAEAFTETGATSPTGAGKISPSASKIEKVGTSYFS